ncbi:uncharacterized protein LOC118408523 isoform X1 [Branchiostoma floridae]|uniref:5'-AMP-activated protein kinase subunit beta-1 n=1 Tax=Branchiostoma floridae TaxID=7739 RepID=A0A9J7HW02_BRAFL|nr:uncharacterized protein LOC118408523 isoform X1 [Branchiostoma floridae]
MSSYTVMKGPLAEKFEGAGHHDHGDATSQMLLEEWNTTWPVRIVWNGHLDEETYIVGSWDSWKSWNKVTKIFCSDRDEESYKVELELPAGLYEYRYRTASGSWFHNQDMPTTMNRFGTFNNILDVPAAATPTNEEMSVPTGDSFWSRMLSMVY